MSVASFVGNVLKQSSSKVRFFPMHLFQSRKTELCTYEQLFNECFIHVCVGCWMFSCQFTL